MSFDLLKTDLCMFEFVVDSRIASRISRKVEEVLTRSTLAKVKILLLRRDPQILGSEMREGTLYDASAARVARNHLDQLIHLIGLIGKHSVGCRAPAGRINARPSSIHAGR